MVDLDFIACIGEQGVVFYEKNKAKIYYSGINNLEVKEIKQESFKNNTINSAKISWEEPDKKR